MLGRPPGCRSEWPRSRSGRCRSCARIFALDERFRGIDFTLPEALLLADEGFDEIFVGYPTTDGRRSRSWRRSPRSGPTRTRADGRRPALDLIEAAARGSGDPCAWRSTSIPSWWARRRAAVRIGPKRCRSGPASRRGGSRMRSSGVPGPALSARWPTRATSRASATRSRAGRCEARRSASCRPLRGRAGPAPAGRGRRDSRGRGPRVGELWRHRQPLAERAARRRDRAHGGLGLLRAGLFDNYRSLDPDAGSGVLPRRDAPAPVPGMDDGARWRVRRVGRAGPTGSHVPPWRRARPPTRAPARCRRRSRPGGQSDSGSATGCTGHAKAGELCERFNSLYLLEGDRIVDHAPTYRGAGPLSSSRSPGTMPTAPNGIASGTGADERRDAEPDHGPPVHGGNRLHDQLDGRLDAVQPGVLPGLSRAGAEGGGASCRASSSRSRG